LKGEETLKNEGCNKEKYVTCAKKEKKQQKMKTSKKKRNGIKYNDNKMGPLTRNRESRRVKSAKRNIMTKMTKQIKMIILKREKKSQKYPKGI
jgi:hypothetical protein